MKKVYVAFAIVCGVFSGIWGFVLGGILAGVLMFMVGYFGALNCFMYSSEVTTKREDE